MSAFGNTPMFGSPHVNPVHGAFQHMTEEERRHVMDPMAAYYAQQAATFAERQPGNQ